MSNKKSQQFTTKKFYTETVDIDNSVKDIILERMGKTPESSNSSANDFYNSISKDTETQNYNSLDPNDLDNSRTDTILNETIKQRFNNDVMKHNFYHFYMGMMSLSILFTILSGNDLISDQYPRFKYNFWSIFPSHIAVPISILLINSYSKALNLNNRIYVSSIVASVCVDCVLLFAYLKKDNIWTYI